MLQDLLSKATSLQIIVTSLLIGASIAALSLFYTKWMIGGFVRNLLSSGAGSPDTAHSLEELGYAKNRFVRYALRDGSVLRKMVWEIGDNYTTDASGFTYSARTRKMDINTARFYIDESNRIRAELRYNANGSDVITLLVGLLLFAVAAAVILILAPLLTETVGSIFNWATN